MLLCTKAVTFNGNTSGTGKAGQLQMVNLLSLLTTGAISSALLQPCRSGTGTACDAMDPAKSGCG